MLPTFNQFVNAVHKIVSFYASKNDILTNLSLFEMKIDIIRLAW